MSSLEGLSLEQLAGPLPVRTLLPNGVELLVEERLGCGLMSAQVWVRSGSLHEGDDLGAGLSHYLEHMLFKGSARMTSRQLTDRTAQLGCTSNAYTTFDRTVYHLDGPEEALEGALEILSDMTLAPRLDDADAALEKSVILREIDMCADDHDGILAEAVLAEAFRAHPMRYPVIGHRARFAAVTPERLRAYHAQRYVTENIVVAVAGSVPAARVQELVTRWFGRFPRRSPGAAAYLPEPPPAAAREVRLTREVATARGVLLWRTPGILAPESLALDLATGILGAGRDSRLWKALRERQQLVHAISASTWGVEDMGLIWVGWSGDASTDPRQVEAAVQQVIEEFLAQPIDSKEFSKVRRQAAVGMVNARKTIHGLASRLGYHAAIARDERQGLANARDLAALTPDQVLAAARAHLKPTSRTVASMRAKPLDPQELIAREANTQLPAFEVRTLPNGVRVVLQHDASLPKVSLGVMLNGGRAYETTGREGESALLATLLARDTARRTAAEVAAETGRLGLTFRPHASQFSLGLLAEGLSADFVALAELVADGVLTPKFVPATVAKERAAQAAACREALDEVVELARQRLLTHFYGSHPLATPAEGTAERVEALQPEHLAALHRRLCCPANLVVGIAGDYDVQQVETFISSRLAQLEATSFTPQVLVPHQARATEVHRETVDREQAVILLGFPHCGFADPRVTAANLTEELLSGMSSGLFRRVREEKGLAYFVGASRLEMAHQGMFYLYSGTHTAAVATVEAEMRGELARLAAAQLQPGELEAAKLRLRVSRREARQTPMGRLPGALLRELTGLGANYEATWESRLTAATAEDIAMYVRDYLRTQDEALVVLLPKPESVEHATGEDR